MFFVKNTHCFPLTKFPKVLFSRYILLSLKTIYLTKYFNNVFILFKHSLRYLQTSKNHYTVCVKYSGNYLYS